MHFLSNMLGVSSSVSYCKLMTLVREALREVTTVVSGAIGQASTAWSPRVRVGRSQLLHHRRLITHLPGLLQSSGPSLSPKISSAGILRRKQNKQILDRDLGLC